MRISDWSSDVCSSDLRWLYIKGVANASANWLINSSKPAISSASKREGTGLSRSSTPNSRWSWTTGTTISERDAASQAIWPGKARRSEEHTSELQSLMRISYSVFCLKKKNNIQRITKNHTRY